MKLQRLGIGLLLALIPLQGLAQVQADWRYWRTLNLEMGLGPLDQYIDINSVRGSNNVWELQLRENTRFSTSFIKMQINCHQYRITFLQGTRIDLEGNSTDITTQLTRMQGLTPGDANDYCQLFTQGHFRNLPRFRQEY